jgi:hypothetical protein
MVDPLATSFALELASFAVDAALWLSLLAFGLGFLAHRWLFTERPVPEWAGTEGPHVRARPWGW